MIFEVCPEFEKYATVKLEPGLEETFCINITSSSRFCQINFYKNRKIPTCEFYWEKFYVFEFPMESKLETAEIFKRWFCENAMPADLVREFAFLDAERITELTDFGKVIEADFIRSWDGVEEFYKNYSEIFRIETTEILNFIAQMRTKSYDKVFRAGNSLFALVLSRSLYHGLRGDQASLIFEFLKNTLKIYTSQDDRIKNVPIISTPHIELTPEIERLLKDLEIRKID
jgi:hypothetical protein